MVGENPITTDDGAKRKYDAMEVTDVQDDEETEEDTEEEETEEEGDEETDENEDSGQLFEVLKEAGLFQQTSGTMSVLPMEIFFDILSRVPVKTISQCRWVCKAWFYSIQHPLFIEMQHRRAMESNYHFVIIDEPRGTDTYFMIDHEGFKTNAPEITKLPELPRMSNFVLFMDSCNGILFFQEPPYLICNPITGEWILPPTSPKEELKDILSCFGFDSTAGKYKVMHVVEIKKDYVEAEVHTLGSEGWRTIPNVPYTFQQMERNVFVNGAFHWIGTEPRKCAETEVIISFHLDIEEFRVNPLPHWFQKSSGVHSLFELGGCLCVRRWPHHGPTELWVLKRYGDEGSWSKEYVFRDMEYLQDPFDPLKVMKTGKLLLKCDSEHIGYYDPKKKKGWKFDDIDLDDHLPEKRCLWQTVIHVGSLISPRDLSRPTKRST